MAYEKYEKCEELWETKTEIHSYELPPTTIKPPLNTKYENCSTDFTINDIYLQLVLPPATGGVSSHNPTRISTNTENKKTNPTEWPVGTTYKY